ncbi:MAG: hypothetical protein IJS39_00530 [Synergistaceae bacterium]|nr:hypothetical protein [Synergistaceae bacterium]
MYHSQEELEALIMKVSHENIEPLSLRIYENFDEGMTADYADKLLEIYSAKLD